MINYKKSLLYQPVIESLDAQRLFLPPDLMKVNLFITSIYLLIFGFLLSAQHQGVCLDTY